MSCCVVLKLSCLCVCGGERERGRGGGDGRSKGMGLGWGVGGSWFSAPRRRTHTRTRTHTHARMRAPAHSPGPPRTLEVGSLLSDGLLLPSIGYRAARMGRRASGRARTRRSVLGGVESRPPINFSTVLIFHSECNRGFRASNRDVECIVNLRMRGFTGVTGLLEPMRAKSADVGSHIARSGSPTIDRRCEVRGEPPQNPAPPHIKSQHTSVTSGTRGSSSLS